MTPQGSVWGDSLRGENFNTRRDYSMTETAPPEDARWHHYAHSHLIGEDSTVSPLAKQTLEELKRIRIEWLSQFEMFVTEEGAYRWWRWYSVEGGKYICRWEERRLVDAPLPKTPGLWPTDD